MLPTVLETIFDEYYDNDLHLQLTKAEVSGDNLIVDFMLTTLPTSAEGGLSQHWTIEALEYRKNRISFEFAEFMEIKDDHPLLWEFNDTQCELYFNGKCTDHTKLFYDLYTTHKRLFGKHQSFDIFLGEDTGYTRPFQFSNGLLTRGAKKLLEKYAACLKQNGLGFTIVGEMPPRSWTGGQFTNEDTDLKILLLGNTFIIAKEFSFMQHAENNE